MDVRIPCSVCESPRKEANISTITLHNQGVPDFTVHYCHDNENCATAAAQLMLQHEKENRGK